MAFIPSLQTPYFTRKISIKRVPVQMCFHKRRCNPQTQPPNLSVWYRIERDIAQKFQLSPVNFYALLTRKEKRREGWCISAILCTHSTVVDGVQSEAHREFINLLIIINRMSVLAPIRHILVSEVTQKAW